MDNDCDGDIDEGDALDADPWYRDADGDLYGDPEQSVRACSKPAGHVADATDCRDDRDDAHPDLEEVCNDHADNDCDGSPNPCRLTGDQ